MCEDVQISFELAISDQGGLQPARMVGKNSNAPLAARIKKIMQKDEDVGKIAQATPFLIGAPHAESWEAWRYHFAYAGEKMLNSIMPCDMIVLRSFNSIVPVNSVPDDKATTAPVPSSGTAMECLLKKLCERTLEVAQSRDAKTITSSHL